MSTSSEKSTSPISPTQESPASSIRGVSQNSPNLLSRLQAPSRGEIPPSSSSRILPPIGPVANEPHTTLNAQLPVRSRPITHAPYPPAADSPPESEADFMRSNRPTSSQASSSSRHFPGSLVTPSWDRQPSRVYDTSPQTYSPLLLRNPSIPTHAGGVVGHLSYHLQIVQQPQIAAECGDAVLSRLPLAPPLIVQLVIYDDKGRSLDIDAIRSLPDMPFFIAHLSLYTSDGMHELDAAGSTENAHFPPDRLLYGSIVSSPQDLQNLQGSKGMYFLFPDVSVRRQGQYSLRVKLVRVSTMDPTGVVNTSQRSEVLAETRTLPFNVWPRQAYVAPPQTPLTEYFLQQGARMYAFASRPARLPSTFY
ncbi:velvet factor-domain-containing protein [Amylostereum chailletii]|nr:velvet factor-domain-containing protein [Amylostereum chailletii]